MGGGRRVRAYVGLGANLGAPRRTLQAAVHAMAALPRAHIRGVSRLYATRPVGVIDQPGFMNAVVALDVPTGPDPGSGALALLLVLKGLEVAFGRRSGRRWGPRELDLDLLVFGSHRIHVQRPTTGRSDDPSRPGIQWLDVPHAAARDRLFVLAPLADLAPGLVPPGWGTTVESRRRAREAVEKPDAVRPIGRWTPARGWVAEGDHVT